MRWARGRKGEGAGGVRGTEGGPERRVAVSPLEVRLERTRLTASEVPTLDKRMTGLMKKTKSRMKRWFSPTPLC